MINNQKDLNIISKKIIASKNFVEFHNPILMDEKIRRSLFKEEYNTHLSNKKNEDTTINLAHALDLSGMKNDLGLDQFLKIIKNELSTSKNHKLKQQNTTKKKIKKYGKVASKYFEKNNNLKQYILKKTKPYLQNNLEKEDIFNMFMGVFLFAINKLGYNQIKKLNENEKNLWVEKKLKAGIDATFNFKLHQFEQSHNYYFHGLLTLSSVFLIFNCINLIHNFSSEFKEENSLPELNIKTIISITNLLILVNTTPLSSHNIMINQPKNQKGTASYLLRTLKSIPESTQCKALKQNCALSMSLLLMCFLELSNKNLVLNCLAIISVLYSFTQKSSNDHAIQFKHKKCPLGFSFKRLGISNSDFNKDMTQTERNWFQRQIFDLFTDRELNQFTLRQNVSLSLTRYENFIGCIRSQKKATFSEFKVHIKNLVNNLVNQKDQSPVQEIAQVISMPGQLSITELQESLYRMLRGKLTSATFSVENSIDFVNATNNMASSFFSSIPFNIHSLKKNRSEALQTEVLDMVPIIENLATELATARMTFLYQNTWFKTTSEQEGILIELKKQLTMISTNTSYDQLLKKIVTFLISDFKNYEFKRIIGIIHTLFNDLGRGKLSDELLKMFNVTSCHEREETFVELFESMNYVCLTNSLDEQKWQRFLKTLCSSPKLSPLLDCDLKESIRNWQSIKDELLNKKVPNDILDEVEKFIKRHSDTHKEKQNKRAKVLEDIKDIHRKLFGIWPGQLKGMILAITETSASTLIQLGRIPLKDQRKMAQSYLNQIKQKIESKNDLFIDTKKGEDFINSQIEINGERLEVIQAHHIEHWLIQVENILLTKLSHIEKSKRNKRFSQFNKFLKLMRICINSKRLSSAIENDFNGFDLNNKEKEILTTLNDFKASNIWNSNIAYLIQNRIGIDQSAAITEFLSKAGAVPFIIGRNSFHILEHHSKNMSRIQQTDTNQFCNDHSPNHFRLNRYKSKNINSTIHKGNFHTFIAAFGYAPACPFSKQKKVSNLRSCPGRSLPFHEISSALNVAALTGVAFRFQSEDGEFQDFNSSKKVDYNDHTLALSPKGRLITIEME